MNELLVEASAELEAAIRLRRHLHRSPELGLQLPLTQATVLDELDGLGLALAEGTTTSSIVATLRGDREGPTILLRADMDALPMPEDTGADYASRVDGCMHACGHDAHTAMLVGAARLLTARRGELQGSVRFMFQPGEEGHHGARFMIDEGLLADGEVARAFAIHQTPTLPCGLVATKGGPMLASSDVLRITVTGRGGHASMPHHALDPIPIACEMVMAIQSLVTRRVDVFDPSVITVARIAAGTTNNVIPESAEIEGTIRSVSEGTRARVHAALVQLVEGIAAAHGANATVDIEHGYPVTTNDDSMAAWALDLASGLGAQTLRMPNPVMGAEDFSYVLQRVPGAMVFLGAAPPGYGWFEAPPNHSNRMMLDENAMTTGIALYTAAALSYLVT